jgi:hypothetical protein
MKNCIIKIEVRQGLVDFPDHREHPDLKARKANLAETDWLDYKVYLVHQVTFL